MCFVIKLKHYQQKSKADFGYVNELLIVLLTMIISPNFVSGTNESDVYIMTNHGNYTKEPFNIGIDSPCMFSIDDTNHKLYFSANNKHIKDHDYGNETGIFKCYQLDLITNKIEAIVGVYECFATAVNNIMQEVYLGGKYGIYKYDAETKTATKMGTENRNIWHMYFKEYLHYVVFPEERAYYMNVETEKSYNFEPLNKISVISYVLNRYNNIFYSNNSGVYIKTLKGITVKIMSESSSGMNTDVVGNVYIPSAIGLRISKYDGKLLRSKAGQGVLSVAPENDGNIIVGINDDIVRLKPRNPKT